MERKVRLNKSAKRFLAVLAAVFVLGMAIWIGTLAAKSADLKEELNEAQKEYDAYIEENNALEALVDEENETALMEEYARKAGYVYADERVYINGN